MPIQTSFNPKGRKELKHAISKAEYYVLRNKLSHFMKRDPNAGLDGKYLIRSTYFDNLDNKILNEKKEGFLNRDKYRVRIYGKGVTEDISSQNTILMTFDEFQEAGTPVYVENSKEEQVFLVTPEKEFKSILITTPDLVEGETYTLSAGGSVKGDATDGVYEQGSIYTNGKVNIEFSITSIMTYLNEDGVTDEAPGMMGGFGGGPGGGMGGRNPFDQNSDSSNK